MNTTVKLTLAVLSGVVIGGFGIEATSAQSKPPVFVVAEFEVTDPGGWKMYSDGPAPPEWGNVPGSSSQGDIPCR